MNIPNVIHQLQSQYPNKDILQNKDDNGQVIEIICEVESTKEHPGWSKAIVVADRSLPHMHKQITETYTVIKGTLNVYIENEEHNLTTGQSITIPPNKIHHVEGNATWFEAHSEPGWYLEDHIVE